MEEEEEEEEYGQEDLKMESRRHEEDLSSEYDSEQFSDYYGYNTFAKGRSKYSMRSRSRANSDVSRVSRISKRSRSARRKTLFFL